MMCVPALERKMKIAVVVAVMGCLMLLWSGSFQRPEIQYGNAGDPYAGTAPDPSAVPLSSCGELSRGTSYRLDRDVSSGDVCFEVAGPGVTLDLGGFSVRGRIVSLYEDGTPDGLTVFNGSVACNNPKGACIEIERDSAKSKAGLRFHHLTLANAALTGTALSVNWDGGGPGVKIHHISATAVPGGVFNSSRSDLLSVSGRGRQSAEFSYNDLTCPDTRSCEAIICYSLQNCSVHHNRVVMASSTSDEPGRAILVDGDTNGNPHPINQHAEIYENDITANNCRAIRIRNATRTTIHDNTIRSISRSGEYYIGALHLGDPDSGSVDLKLDAYNNTFHVQGGTVLMVRNGYGAVLRDSTVTGNTGRLANVRSGGGTTRVRLERNRNSLPVPSVEIEAGATATVCKSGTADGAVVTNGC